MPTIELDYVSDHERDRDIHVRMDPNVARPLIEESVRKFLTEADFTDVTFEIKQVFGPAGGASVIDFTAPSLERLREFVAMYDGDNGEVDWLMELVRV